jgi:hypothetical protein
MGKHYFYKVSGPVNLTYNGILAGNQEEAIDIGKFLIKDVIEKAELGIGEIDLTAESIREATREELVEAYGEDLEEIENEG